MAGLFDNRSTRYFVAHYRKEETINQEDVLEKFIWFLEDEDTGFTPKQTKQIKAAVDQLNQMSTHSLKMAEWKISTPVCSFGNKWAEWMH